MQKISLIGSGLLFSLAANFSPVVTSAENVETNSVQICHHSLTSGDYQQALLDCQQQLDLNQKELSRNGTSSARSSRLDSDTLDLYLYLIDIYHALGDANQESNYLDKVVQHPLFSKVPRIGYLWHRKMGQRNYFAKDFQQAKQHLYEGLKIAEQQNNRVWLSKSYNDVGLIEQQMGDFKKSLINYKKSLEIKLELGDRYTIGTTLNNIGLIYAKLEDYEESAHYYEQALDSFLKYTEQSEFDHRVFDNIAHIYEDLAIAYSHTDNTDKENYYQQLIVESIDNKNSTRQQSRALINIAKLQLEKAQYPSARAFLDKAAALQKEKKFDLRLEIDFQFSRYYLLTGEFDKAISYANGGVILAREKNDLLTLANLYQVLDKAYQKSDINTAYHYLQSYADTREAYLAQKFDSDLKSVQVQIEKQQVEHELMLQQIENGNNQVKIQTLTNWSLSIVILFLLGVGFIVFYLFKKKKEKQALLQSITYHQQQLLSLDDKYQTLSKSIESDPANKMDKPDLRVALVNTMLNAVSIWESHTGKNRVELAEKSKIWTVSVDGGTLRTRSLDKYLSLDKIPHNPRWRNVAGTCHFILSDPELDANSRSKLNENLDSLMQAVKAVSLTASETDS